MAVMYETLATLEKLIRFQLMPIEIRDQLNLTLVCEVTDDNIDEKVINIIFLKLT